MAHSDLVAITIAAMNRRAESMADALHAASLSAYVKGTTGSHQYSPHVDALFRAGGDNSSDHIPCLVALDPLSSFGLGAGEAALIDIALLAAAMPGRRNQQGSDTSHLERWWRTRADTGRVHPMLLRQLSLRSIVFRQAT